MDSGSAFIIAVGGGSITLTVTLSIASPPGPSAAMVYVVVSVGETMREPLTSTTSISGSITQLSASVEDHDRVLDSP